MRRGRHAEGQHRHDQRAVDASAVTGGLTSRVGCHNGFTLPLGCPQVMPPQGCLQNREKIKLDNGETIFRLTMVAPTNGKWGTP
jgi:hypothetical protein